MVYLPAAARIPPMLLGTVSEPDVQQWHAPETMKQFKAWLHKWKPEVLLTEATELPDLLKKAGLAVPDDIAAVALNVLDVDFDAGIYQNPGEIGRVAALVVLSLINDHARGTPPLYREILIEGTWTDGKSLPLRATTRRSGTVRAEGCERACSPLTPSMDQHPLDSASANHISPEASSGSGGALERIEGNRVL
jgi:hypothetical protein